MRGREKLLTGALIAFALSACSTVLGLGDPSPRDPGGADDGLDGGCRGDECVACGPGERACEHRCVVLEDPAHCGRCGRSCQGGTCTDGRCSEVLLAGDLTRARSLVAAEGAVYFIGGSGEPVVMRAPRVPIPCDGTDARCRLPSPAKAFPPADPNLVPSHLAVKGNELLVAVPEVGVARRALAAGANEPFMPLVATPNVDTLALAVAGTVPVAVARRPAWAVALESGGLRPLAESPFVGSEGEVPYPFGVTSQGPGHVVAWMTHPSFGGVASGIHRVPVDPSPGPCLGNGCFLLAGPVFAVTSYGDDLAVALPDESLDVKVGIIPAGTTSCEAPSCPTILVRHVPVVFDTRAQGSLPLLLDDQYLYWVAGASTPQVLQRTRRDTPCHSSTVGSCEPLLESRLITSIAQDATTLFAAVDRNNQTQVVALAK